MSEMVLVRAAIAIFLCVLAGLALTFDFTVFGIMIGSFSGGYLWSKSRALAEKKQPA